MLFFMTQHCFQFKVPHQVNTVFTRKNKIITSQFLFLIYTKIEVSSFGFKVSYRSIFFIYYHNIVYMYIVYLFNDISFYKFKFHSKSDNEPKHNVAMKKNQHISSTDTTRSRLLGRASISRARF